MGATPVTMYSRLSLPDAAMLHTVLLFGPWRERSRAGLGCKDDVRFPKSAGVQGSLYGMPMSTALTALTFIFASVISTSRFFYFFALGI